MKYEHIQPAVFCTRPNRFIAHVEIEGKEEVVHVKNTGRCKELLVPGCTVFLEAARNPKRKTPYDLVAVYKNERLINMDSQVCNKVVEEFLRASSLFENITLLKPECQYDSCRFDFYLEYGDGKKAFIEVKGVTLENDNIAAFPDAPTQRGARHVSTLIEAMKEGYEAYVFFLIQMEGIEKMEPNWQRDPDFAKTLQQAHAKGVQILCYESHVEPDEIRVSRPVEFSFGHDFIPPKVPDTNPLSSIVTGKEGTV